MFENVLQALESLRSNKMRSVLTMLGIIIGIAAVIAIISLGNSLSATMNDYMASMGVNNITVRISQVESSRDNTSVNAMGNLFGGGWGAPTSSTDLISLSQIENMEEEFGDRISYYSISESVGSGQVKSGDKYANASVTGVSQGYCEANDMTILSGRFIENTDVKSTKTVCVVSDKLVETIFGENADVIGEVIKVYFQNAIKQYTIIGVYEYEASALELMGSTVSEANVSTGLYIPVTTGQTMSRSKGFQSFTVVSASTAEADLESLTNELSTYWSRQYRKNASWTASASNMQSAVSQANSMLSIISTVLAVIAAISLLVGGIGVMNIMLVSVTERTHEIGVRKALGAQDSQIRIQFVTEAGILCMVGGIIGVIFGLLLALAGVSIMGSAMGMNATLTISAPVILIAVGFSLLIGVFFGYYPANKAAKLDPIDALRYE